MKKIRIAQIGLGHNHGADKMVALRHLPDIFEVVGVVEGDPVWRQKRGGLPAYQDIPFLREEELFRVPGLEAVVVETDLPDLVPTAWRCAKRGLHIHLDKPGGESLPPFRKLVGACAARSLALQLAYVYRYNPALRFCCRVAAEGWLGDIFEIHAVMSRDDSEHPDYRRWLAQFKGGAMLVFAGYLIDLVLSLLGKPEKITPFLRQTRKDGLIDNGLAVFEYPRATATVRVSVAEIEGMRHRRLIVCGTQGTVELCPIEHPAAGYYSEPLRVRLTLKEGRGDYPAGTHQVDCGVLGSRYEAQLREFAAIVRGAMDNPYPYAHELLLQQSLLAASGYAEEART